MSATKRIHGNYHISTKTDANANVIVSTHTLFIDGNLLVGGDSTAITKTDTDITDNVIVLNKGETGAGVSLVNSGIEIDRGTLPNTHIYWNEGYQKWIATEDGVTERFLITSTVGGTIHIVDDLNPQLGGNLDVLARTVFSSNTQVVTIDSNIALTNTSTPPSTISNYNVIYANVPASGGSGLYTTNTQNANREVASVRRAIIYSLVL